VGRAVLTLSSKNYVRLSPLCEAYRERVMDWAPMREWIGAAKSEPEQLEELDVEF
jgi:glutathione S-transferase